MTSSPPVSVFMTVRNEERDLRDCVERILAQAYDGPFELVVAVGPSDDATAEIADELAVQYPQLTIVDNPTGLTPHGLNAAIAGAAHDFLVRADGHALFPRDYVERVTSILRKTGAANVGGSMVPRGTNAFSRAVARAMSSRFGIGGAAFHTGAAAGPQATVYLGSFRRDALDKVGGYDEYFLRAQDWELNHRLRDAGEIVWFDPSLEVVYHPRDSWKEFARQQFKTGGWRRKVMKKHPESLNLRYLAPPTATALSLAGAGVGLAGFFTSPLLLLGLAVPGAYLVGVSVAGWIEGSGLDLGARRKMPLVFATMHLSWGLGFLRNA